MKAFYERAQPRDSDPMRNFGERDLVRLTEEAGFAEVRLDFEAEVVRGNPPGWGNNAWTIVAKAAPNPLVPSRGGRRTRIVARTGTALTRAP